ncbi:hypothetical protein PAXRUDRAFT_338372 [Paxillus rubicundulus Ve08.2h10]|uniref:Uncharacterized protein n=1 Tax=Paxillus rubicundulus Ve08.2h10 TaxID=930991 RepID=A0A0D0C4Y1_9AGAM|nr:hypothetical protein PAXRUDRAFT_338372 [Paxillus rubicundulus Ve08.2h10]
MFSTISMISPRIGFVQARSSFILAIQHVCNRGRMKNYEEVVYADWCLRETQAKFDIPFTMVHFSVPRSVSYTTTCKGKNS